MDFPTFILSNRVNTVVIKSLFLLSIFFYSFSFANTNIDNGDQNFEKENYLRSIEDYKLAYQENHPEAKIKLITTYLKLGDNFKTIQNYEKAIEWYQKAFELDNSIAKNKIAIAYENQGDLYAKIKNHQIAMQFYKKALELGKTDISSKIKSLQEEINHQNELKDDTRKLVTNASPPWTSSIGRIIVPTKLEFITHKKYKTDFKKCSASLVNLDGYESSKVIVTASHCLSEYKQEAGDIRFIIKNSKNERIQRFATIYKDSHFNEKKLKTASDYAILILDEKISTKEVTPLKITPKSFLKLKNGYKYSFASLAGFSSDIGEYGAKLTFDPKCELNPYNNLFAHSNCSGFKGASGGPVVMSVSDDDIQYEYYFVGVVSHFLQKNFKNIYFAPSELFYDEMVGAMKF